MHRKRVLHPRVPITGEEAEDRVRRAPVPRNLIPIMIRDLNLWEIKYEGGGPVPLPLRGLYTSKRVAYIAIEKFKQAQ